MGSKLRRKEKTVTIQIKVPSSLKKEATVAARLLNFDNLSQWIRYLIRKERDK